MRTPKLLSNLSRVTVPALVSRLPGVENATVSLGSLGLLSSAGVKATATAPGAALEEAPEQE